MRLLMRTMSYPDSTMGFMEFGEMLDGFPGIFTMEPPWKGNTPFISCVPSGFYRLVRTDDGNYAGRFALVGECVDIDPGPRVKRTRCVIHAANWAYQLQGCIGPGMTQGMAKADKRDHCERMVGQSRNALELLEKRLLLNPDEDHYLTIDRDVLTTC